MNITGSTLTANDARTGGAIVNGGTLNMKNSTITANTAAFQGGGINNNGTLIMVNNTVTGNETQYGGGIYSDSTNGITLHNNLITGNRSTWSSTVHEMQVDGGSFSSEYNLFGTQDGVGVGGTVSYIQGLGDIPGPPFALNAIIDGLALHGGLTQTHLPKPGGPAIDNGNNALFPAIDTATDQQGAGYPRRQPATTGTIDIGAVEYSSIGPVYTVTAVALDGNGAISPASRTVSAGAIATFTVIANSGYTPHFTMTGCNGSLSGKIYITDPINANCAIEVSFAAATNVVNSFDDVNDGSCDTVHCSLREAVLNASAGDTVSFTTIATPKTIALSSEISLDKNLTIQGPGSGLLILSGNNATRIFTVAASKTVVIDGLTLKDGLSADPGGAILNNGNLTVSNSTFTDNDSTTTSGFNGGGAIQNFGTLAVNSTSFSGNTAVRGGAINNEVGGTANLSNSTLVSNTATAISDGGGGGIFSQGALTVNACVLTSNTATSKGGGLYIWDGTAAVSSSTLTGNSAKSGGGISNEASTSTLTLRNSTLSGNSSNGGSGFGGGGLGNYQGTITLINSTVSGNTANNVGGGLTGGFGPVTLTNSTITGNSANYGGGIYTENVLTLGNSLIAGNTATIDGKEIRVAGGTLNSQGYNLLGENGASGLSGATPISTDRVPDVGLLIGNILGGLANTGGPTETHLPIAGSSPVINAGNNALLAGLTTDQRGVGFPRIQPAIGTVDIGAVEDLTGIVNLTVIKAGTGDGTVSSSPAGLIDCGLSCVASFSSADTVILTAAPDVDSSFTGWSGGGCSGTGTCIVTMNRARTVTAGFGALVSFVVTNRNDTGTGSLRTSIASANSTPGADTIGFQAGLTGTIPLTSGEIVISDDTTLQGPGANAITVSGSGLSRIFTVATGKTVTISGLTLSNGSAANDGGAIVNNGNLTVSAGTVSDNTAAWGGGGIANASSSSVLTVFNSTLSGNIANSGGSGHGGGAIFNYLGTVSVINSTVSGNAVPTNTGGGLDNYGILTVTSSTITDNSANTGGGIYTENLLTLGNSLIAGNTAAVDGKEIRVTTGGSFASQGYNLFGENGASGLSGATPISTDLVPDVGLLIGDMVSALANNGGPTLTHLPIPGSSPVINAGNNGLATGLLTDQRGSGFPRRQPSIGTVDIGAVEDLTGIVNLTVIKAGTGHGTVSSSPAGLIDCGVTCVAGFASADTVTLTAAPDADSSFTGWSGGGCSGTGTCIVTMNRARTVTAGFGALVSFLVTNLDDSGPESLRDSIASANSTPGADTIGFQAGLTGTIPLTSGEIVISDDATLQGPGANAITVSGSGLSRIFTVAAGKTVTISGLTLSNGSAVNDGGAIVNNGNLTVSAGTVSGNTAAWGGGGIANASSSSVLTVFNSTLSGNTANSGGSGHGGGAVFNYLGTVSVINSTVSGNAVPTNTGGGLDNYGTLTVTNSTITGNSANTGGGIYTENLLTLGNSLIAGNTATVDGKEIRVATGGSFASQGYNLFGENGASGLSGATPKADPDGDLVLPDAISTAISPMLANNGGPTLTHLPTATSLTINTGNDALIPAVVTADQRGLPRMVGNAVDIGAVEDSNGATIHLLKVIRAGAGTGTVTGTNIACGATCLANFSSVPNPSIVTLTATPDAGVIFAGWSGACTADPCTVTLDQARTVTAVFETTTSFIVTNLDDSGIGSLRQTVASANAVSGPNTITFDAGLTGGTITLTGGEIAISDDLILDGPGAANLAISGNNAARIFTVAAGKAIEVRGLTLKDGRSAEPGGAILNDGNLTVSNSALSNNASTTTSGFSGGGAIANNGSLTVTDSVLSGNTAVMGGAINNQAGGAALLRNSALTGNSATGTGGGGGALFNRGITLTVDVCTLSGNSAVFKGGGLFAWASSATATEVTNSTVAGNTANSGGGIANQDAGSTLKVLNSTLSGNTANGGVGYGGGGLFNLGGTVAIINSTVSGNPSAHTGGGLDNYGPLTVTNSTVTGNTASYGGGIYTESLLTLGNSLIAGNTAAVDGKEIRVAGGGTFASQGYNLLGENGTSGLSGATPKADPDGDLVLPGAISTALSPTLANNGGPTLTHLPTDTSPAINAGNNALIPADVTTDQRGAGFPRIQPVGGAVDIGAVEANPLNQPALSINDVRQARGSSGTTLFTFTVTLSTAASQPVTVAWATADGTALAGRDYTATSGSLSFAVGGALSQTLTVEVLGGAPSPDQTFFVRLSAPVNATLARIEGIGTILSLASPAAAGLIWTGDQFIAVSIGGQIHTSPDGFTWTAQNSGTTQNLNSVAGSGRQFVAVGSAGTVLTSPDGIGWTSVTAGVTADLQGVAWSGSAFVAVGDGVILTSADGLSWTAQSSGTLYAVTWAGSQWVAVGAGGTILTSSDGFTWTAGATGVSPDLYGLAWSGDQIIAVGNGGTVLTSLNGNAWTTRTSSTSQDLSGIAWSGSQFLAGGTGGVLLASPDGIAWTPQAAGTPEDLYGIAWAGDRWLAVGANATRIALARTWGDLKPLIQNRWTMLGLPGIPGTTTASTALAGLDPAAYLTEWSVYDYDLATRQYRQLPPTAPLSQTSGYWIIDQGSVAHTVQLTAPATATPVGFSAGCPSTRGCYEIPLTAPSGTDAHLFHLIGMPFPYPVGWWEVRLEVDGTAIPLDDARNVYVAPGYWVWNGNDYDTHDSATPGSAGLLQPWQGIWVKVLAAGQGHTLKLLIPRLPKYSHVPTPARPIPGWQKALDWLIPPAVAAESERRWYVRLIAEEPTTPMRTRNSVLGQLPDSVDGYDAHDLPKMAPFAAPYLSIAFPQPAWGTRADDYATDYRPSGAARLPPATWRFEVRTDRAGYAVTLRWEGPPDLLGRMELVDEDTGRRYPAGDPGVLRNGVPVTMTAPVRHFTWIFAGQPAP